MAVTVDSSNGLVNLAVGYKDITGKKQTIHYLFAHQSTQAATDTLLGTVLNSVDQMSNAVISRVATSILPAVAGLKTSPTDAVGDVLNNLLSVPYVKNYVAYTFIGGTLNEAGNRVDYPFLVPAPNNLTDVTSTALSNAATNPGIGPLQTAIQTSGAYPIGYAFGQRAYHSGDLTLDTSRSGYMQVTATGINS